MESLNGYNSGTVRPQRCLHQRAGFRGRTI